MDDKFIMENIVGKTFFEWTVLGISETRKAHKDGTTVPSVKCQCSCGTIRDVNCYNLINNKSHSCGCRPGKLKREKYDITGKTFGQYYVEGRGEDYVSPKGHVLQRWNVRCSCGNTNLLTTHELVGGLRTMCPECSKLVSKTRTHGMTNTRLYNVYREMKRRCYTKTNHNYKNYGARGIRMCRAWKKDFLSFYKWAVEQGYDESAPRGQYTIERINVNGNYCPENCRLATIQEQSQNTRRNKFVKYNGKKYSLADFSRLTGVPYDRVSRWREIMSAEEMIIRNQETPYHHRLRLS